MRLANTKRTTVDRNYERGLVITLVAVVLLFVVGAMAVLAIDVATFHTARSEAQIAADAGALAGARVLANSGATSDSSIDASALAGNIAEQVAMGNTIGGKHPSSAGSGSNCGKDVCVAFNNPTPKNPQITVEVTRTDLPTFFARIWGHTSAIVTASATAEAYNPSGPMIAQKSRFPIATTCVKPWLLPNIDPSSGPGNRIFDVSTGDIKNDGLLGWETPDSPITRLVTVCPGGNCSTLPPPEAWKYYPGAPDDFPAPSPLAVACGSSATLTAYQLSIAGCVQAPIACGSNASSGKGVVNIDQADYSARDAETSAAVDCLARTGLPSLDGGDAINQSPAPPPFEFLAGANNLAVRAGQVVAGTPMLVSNSLVTVPVYDSNGNPPVSPVKIIGFVQLFLQPDGKATSTTGGIKTTVTNLAGCGTILSGPPTIIGNGPSAVAVRLIQTQQ